MTLIYLTKYKIFFREIPNPAHKENLLKLNNFVMVKYDQDKTVTPKESQWLAIQNYSFRGLIILFSILIIENY